MEKKIKQFCFAIIWLLPINTSSQPIKVKEKCKINIEKNNIIFGNVISIFQKL